MKPIALSMLFSLAVIVCEQQTLFAPHITTFEGLKAANSLTNGRCLERRIVGGTMCSVFADDSPTNSLVPIAGVNRSVPLAGSGNGVISAATEFVKNDIWVLDTGAGLEHGPGMHDSLHNIRGEEDQPIRGEKDQPFDNDLGPIHNDSAFLPWHRG